jgi:hypothetical protein
MISILIPLLLLTALTAPLQANAAKATIHHGGFGCQPKDTDIVLTFEGDRRILQLRKGTVTSCGKAWVVRPQDVDGLRFAVSAGWVDGRGPNDKKQKVQIEVRPAPHQSHILYPTLLTYLPDHS